MNDKIKELAEKSYSFANEVYSNMETEPEGEFDEWFNEIVMGKFAELIVKECIDILKPTEEQLKYPYYYLGGSEGNELLENNIEAIKDHFGIEQ